MKDWFRRFRYRLPAGSIAVKTRCDECGATLDINGQSFLVRDITKKFWEVHARPCKWAA